MAVTNNYSMTLPTVGGDLNVWGTSLNSGVMTKLDTFLGSVLAVPISSADVNLTTSNFSSATVFVLSGALNGNHSLTLPLSPNSATVACAGRFVVINNTSGAFNVTVKTVAIGSTGVTVPQGFAAYLTSDGTNVSYCNTGFPSYAYAVSGNPNGQLAGTAGSVNTHAQLAFDYTNGLLYVCTTTGTSSTAVWSSPFGTLQSWTTGGRPTSVTGRFGLNTTFGVPEVYNGTSWLQLVTAQAMPSVSGLVVQNNSGTPNTKIDITADNVVLTNASGVAVRFQSVSVTIDSTVTGVNGCDVGTRAADTNYFVWLVATDTAIGGLLSTSPTAPTLPGSYTFKKRVSWNRTDSSSNFKRVLQRDSVAQYVITVGTNTAVAPNIASGIASTFSLTSPTLSSVSISGVVPSTATRIGVLAFNHWKFNAIGDILVAPSISWGGVNNGPMGSAGQVWPYYADSAINQGAGLFWMLLDSTASIAWCANTTGCAISCLGWEDSI